MDHEVVLKGGRANVGRVVRIGNEVARPNYPQTPSVEHFLHHLIAAGLSFVPQPLAHDDRGRQRLTFIEGSALTPPYPAAAFDEDLLRSIAIHQRRLHRAARDYLPPDGATWAVSAGDYFPDEALNAGERIVCHNDLGMTNTIVDHDGAFVGFIDFDYCRPVDRFFDIAVAARHWVPFGDLDLATEPELDRVRRFGIFCDQHELDTDQRRRVVTFARAFLDKARLNIRSLAEAGHVGFQTLLDTGYEATNLATVDWLGKHAETLAAGK